MSSIAEYMMNDYHGHPEFNPNQDFRHPTTFDPRYFYIATFTPEDPQRDAIVYSMMYPEVFKWAEVAEEQEPEYIVSILRFDVPSGMALDMLDDYVEMADLKGKGTLVYDTARGDIDP